MKSEMAKRYKVPLIFLGVALTSGILFLISQSHIRIGKPMDCFSGCFYETSKVWTRVAFALAGLGFLAVITAIVSGVVVAKEKRKYWLMAIGIAATLLLLWYRQTTL